MHSYRKEKQIKRRNESVNSVDFNCEEPLLEVRDREVVTAVDREFNDDVDEISSTSSNNEISNIDSQVDRVRYPLR